MIKRLFVLMKCTIGTNSGAFLRRVLFCYLTVAVWDGVMRTGRVPLLIPGTGVLIANRILILIQKYSTRCGHLLRSDCIFHTQHEDVWDIYNCIYNHCMRSPNERSREV
jgi:hypothetical protein